jgi:hypothetical protein
VQALLVLTWTLYALFLPGMAAKAGIASSWVIWILVADQAIFAVSDWAAGVYADRVAGVVGRLGRAILLAALISAGMLAAMPWLAQGGHGLLLLIAIAVWAAASSLLRAPAFSLLARMGGVSRKSGVVSWSLVGVSAAGAVGPLLTQTLKQIDPILPLALASAALAVAGWLATGVANTPVQTSATAAPAAPVMRPVVQLTALTGLAALGMQWHTVFGAAAAQSSLAKSIWIPVFWSGFACGLGLAALNSRGSRPLLGCALALAAGAVSMPMAVHFTAPLAVIAAQAGAGAAWAVTITCILAVTFARGQARGVATPLGLVLSALSLAAMARLVGGAFGLPLRVPAGWWPAALWLLAAAGLCLHGWARPAGRGTV